VISRRSTRSSWTGGKLVGYGGGLDRKRWLLARESGGRLR
jgi:O6-methylguanine-DNA--protein-cysteine methyltransferase